MNNRSNKAVESLMRFGKTTTISFYAVTSIFAVLIIMSAFIGSDAQALDRALDRDADGRQRTLFVEVERALKNGDRRLFERHGQKLRAYPLYPYLVYRDLSNRLPRARDKEIETFLRKYADDLPLSDKLRYQWLTQLARRGHWGRFLRHYKESQVVISRENHCNHAYALIRAGEMQQARKAIKTLWLVDFSQPKQCDPVFEYGLEQGYINADLIWQRSLLVWNSGREGLMNYLGNRLRGNLRRWFGLLKQARHDPKKIALEVYDQVPDSPYAGDVLVFALRRLARQDVEEAEKTWRKIRSSCTACRSLRGIVEKNLGIVAAKRLMPKEAYRLLSGLPLEYRDQESRYWRIRSALRSRTWRWVLMAIDDLRGEELDVSQWNYWKAYALSMSGRRTEARSIWRQLAKQDSYYGYLSADKLNQVYPYALFSVGLGDGTEKLAAYPAVSRIRELLILGRLVDANRELPVLMERLDASERLKFAAVADRWQWPIGAIRSLAAGNASGYFLEHFPLPYRDIVSAESRRSKISAEWIYGIMRQESAFVRDIRSPAGALGLMQLLPGTARQVASRLRMKKPSAHGLLSPETNIRLGTAYIKSLYRRSDNNFAVSLAGYNAGMKNARRWLKNAPVSDGAVWVDTIPFDETRLYVRAVLFYTLIYRHRLGKPPMRLRELMSNRK